MLTRSVVLFRELESILGRPIRDLERSLSPYSSSFRIEELKVLFKDGSRANVIFKETGPGGIIPASRGVKPTFLTDPRREAEVYRKLLSPLNLGTPHFYGSTLCPEQERFWMFLEAVEGRELCQIGDFEAWLDAARWLGRFQKVIHHHPTDIRSAIPELFHWQSSVSRVWLERARRFTGKQIEEGYEYLETIVPLLEQLPQTLIHGDFNASNILIQQSEFGLRVCPVDWEMSATGPALMDLAALSSGNWSRTDRLKMLDTYLAELSPHLHPKNPERALDACQAYLALQWLGWSKDWQPRSGCDHDWLSQIHQLCRGIA